MNESELSAYIGSEIKRNRKRRNITQRELGKMIGVKNNTISAYERGTISTDLDVLFKLADVFNTSIDDFFPQNNVIAESPAEYNVTKHYDYYPTAISAGLPIGVDGQTESQKLAIPDELLGRYAGHKDIVILRICGDSMDELMQDGSIIAIKPMPLESLKNGDIVVYSLNGEYGVKQYNKQDNTLIFRPLSTNKAHFDQIYELSNNITIHGKVIMWTVTQD